MKVQEMASRLHRRDDALNFAWRHLTEYFETNLLAKESKARVKTS